MEFFAPNHPSFFFKNSKQSPNLSLSRSLSIYLSLPLIFHFTLSDPMQRVESLLLLNDYWEQVQIPSRTSRVQDVAVCLPKTASLVFVCLIQTEFTQDLLWPIRLLSDPVQSDSSELMQGSGCEQRRLETSSNPRGCARSHLISEWHAVGLGNVMTGSTSSLALSRCSKL